MLATDNRFTGEWCWRMWRRLHRAYSQHKVLHTWHGSDGDARMRLDDYTMNLLANKDANDGWCDGSIYLDLPLFIIHVPRTKEGLWLLGCQDLVHLKWRWRRQLLDDKKTLHFNGYRAGRAHLKDVPWLSEGALDFHNKQNWPAVQAIFSKRTCDFLEAKIAEGEDHR
eukprot:6590522-Prymnesium_polylepis.1